MRFVLLTITFKLVNIIKSLNYILIAVFISVCAKTVAQQFFFKNYSVESGLPFVQGSCMYQDGSGYLWTGGYGGLSRFDGKLFANFNRKNGLIDHNVNAICVDEGGDLFAGTNKGLSVYRNDRFYNFAKNEGLGNVFVTSLCRGYHHAMYIGTKQGLYMFKDDKIKSVKKLAEYKINYLYNPDTSVIFIGTDNGLVMYGHKTFEVINQSKGLASDKVNCVTIYKNQLVIGTSGGLSFYNLQTKKITNYFIAQGLIDENISSVLSQNNKYLWVGTQSGLLRYNGQQFDYYSVGYDNNSNHIRSILEDREHNMWFGTNSGLFRYRDNSFTTFNKITGLGNSFIFQIFRDKAGDLWVCTQNSGIYRGTQNYFKRYGSAHGLKSNTSHAAVQDSSGRLLFGTSLGLVQFNNDYFSQLQLPEGFKAPIEVIFISHDNTVWLGGANGVAALKWEKNTIRSKFYPIYSKIEFAVYGFCEDDNHNLYAGTFKAGLQKLVGDSFVNLSNSLHLNEETFFTIRYLNGKIFGASLNGLLVLDTKTNVLSRITDQDGLNSELIYSIEFTDNKKALWIGTNQGINRLNLEKYMRSGEIEITSFGKHEGFGGVECNSNGIWEDKDHTLWFGTVSGLIKYQPFDFRTNVTENITLIQKITLLNEDTLLKQHSVLPSDYNTIAFYYRGICLTNPEKVLYQKKLEGLEKDWSVPSNEDYSKYANLGPGDYTFKVRSCNNEGIWNSVETSFAFTIKPPFYLTWWFILISLLLTFGIIYLIFALRIINIKKKQKAEFERKVEMSKIELKALRSQMNPHFVFNSLNAIQHYIFNTRSEEAIKYLSKFARLVRVILNNSDKPSVTVGEDIEALRLYLELEQMRFEEKFDYEIIIDKSVDTDYDIMPPLLMQPYVENAILHGLNPKPERGKLTIRLNSENNFLICTITDNGIGRERASEIHRTMPVKNHKSMGMKITEDRLKILNEINNSQLSVAITDLKGPNNEALGTKVELFVPLTG